MKIITIAAKQARIKFGELLERARWEDTVFLITKKSRPMAYLVGAQNKKFFSKQEKKFT